MTKDQIGRIAFSKKMAKHEKAFDALWPKIVQDINTYIAKYGSRSDSHLVEHFCDNMCLSGAWMYDRIQGKTATTHNPEYRGSLTKKIRKALGYNL